MKEYEVIKKNYGEKFAKFCRSNFSTILETEGFLSNFLNETFAPNKFIYEDMINDKREESFKDIVFYEYGLKYPKETIESVETPEELLDKAGYKLYKCKTGKDILSFKKYYKEGEQLCTFKDPEGRLLSWEVFFAVKKNVDKIIRENFKNPQRQDEYGTSVISIQFDKNRGYISIKNRYNHKVDNSDATFSNNLDNIIEGLTSSFKKYYGLNIVDRAKTKYNFNLNNYIIAEDGRLFRFTKKVDSNKYCCLNNTIIYLDDDDNIKTQQYDKDRYEIFDYFILDKKEKTLKSLVKDGFVDSIGKIKKIETIKLDNQEKLIRIINDKNQTTELIINNFSQIISYTNNDIETFNASFLREATELKSITAKNLRVINNRCFEECKKVEKIDFPNLERIDAELFLEKSKLKEISLPKLEYMAGCCFMNSDYLEKLYLPSLKKMSGSCFFYAKNLEEIELPALEEMGAQCFVIASALKKFSAPKLKIIDTSLFSVKKLEELNLNSLEEVYNNKLAGMYCFKKCPRLKKLNSPYLEQESKYRRLVPRFTKLKKTLNIFKEKIEEKKDENTLN